MYLPIRTLRTSRIPRCCIASRTAAPCGSSTAAFGVTTTFIFMGPILMRSARQQALCRGRRRLFSLRDRDFAPDLGRLFVFAQSEENRLPQFRVARPLG